MEIIEGGKSEIREYCQSADGRFVMLPPTPHGENMTSHFSRMNAKRDTLIIEMMRDCIKAEDTAWMPEGNETYFERLAYILTETGWTEERIYAEFPEYFHPLNASNQTPPPRA
jgi:hypothetical protein